MVKWLCSCLYLILSLRWSSSPERLMEIQEQAPKTKPDTRYCQPGALQKPKCAAKSSFNLIMHWKPGFQCNFISVGKPEQVHATNDWEIQMKKWDLLQVRQLQMISQKLNHFLKLRCRENVQKTKKDRTKFILTMKDFAAFIDAVLLHDLILVPDQISVKILWPRTRTQT